jgi:hypothetical protein
VARVMDSMASEVHDNVSAVKQTKYRLIKVEKEKQLGPFWNFTRVKVVRIIGQQRGEFQLCRDCTAR